VNTHYSVRACPECHGADDSCLTCLGVGRVWLPVEIDGTMRRRLMWLAIILLTLIATWLAYSFDWSIR
jgi:hypothetical protein